MHLMGKLVLLLWVLIYVLKGSAYIPGGGSPFSKRKTAWRVQELWYTSYLRMGSALLCGGVMRGIAVRACCCAVILKSGVFSGKQRPQKVLTDGVRHKQMKTVHFPSA